MALGYSSRMAIKAMLFFLAIFLAFTSTAIHAYVPLEKPHAPEYFLAKAPVHPPVKAPVHPPAKSPCPQHPPAKAPVKPPAPAPLVYYPTPVPPPAPIKSNKYCHPQCQRRCQLNSPKRACLRACTACCERCKCVPPGTSGNNEKCGSCYTEVTTPSHKYRCP